MHEPEFYNNTPFTAEPLPLLDKEGADCRVVVVKATFDIRPGTPRIQETQRPLRYGDEMWGPPEIPDIKYPADISVTKPGTDLLVIAHAIAPKGRPAKSFDVEFSLQTLRKRLRVTGPRIWRRGIWGVIPGSPKPTRVVTLSWGNAFGGCDASDPDHIKEDVRNPVGRGVVRKPAALVDLPAPQVEDPRSPVRKPNAKCRPGGCAPIGRHFKPRREFAGTYDDKWLETRYPAKPKDYDDRHENCAPSDQVFPKPLRGGEEVALTNLLPGDPVHFQLPKLRIEIEAEIDGKPVFARPHVDTVLIDTVEPALELSWRASFRCPPKMRGRFTMIQVRQKEFV